MYYLKLSPVKDETERLKIKNSLNLFIKEREKVEIQLKDENNCDDCIDYYTRLWERLDATIQVYEELLG